MVEIRRPKKPYGQHRREFATARGLAASGAEEEPAGTRSASVEEARGDSEANAAPPPASTVERAASADARLRLKFTVHAPLPGAFAYFDRAVALMGEAKALRLVLARAFDQLEDAVTAGEEVSRATLSTRTGRRTPRAISPPRSMVRPRRRWIPWTFCRRAASAESLPWPRSSGPWLALPKPHEVRLYSRSKSATACSKVSPRPQPC
jgi:hypothetical protein